MTFLLLKTLPRALATACVVWAGASAIAPATAQELAPVLPPTDTVVQVLASPWRKRAASVCKRAPTTGWPRSPPTGAATHRAGAFLKPRSVWKLACAGPPKSRQISAWARQRSA